MWLRDFVVNSVRGMRRRKVKSHPLFRDYSGKVDPLILNAKSIVCSNRKFIYFRVPKAANTTVISSLYPQSLLNQFSSSENMSEFKRAMPKLADIPASDVDQVINDYFKFSLVRHPVARFRSCYLDKIANDCVQRRSVARSIGVGAGESISVDLFLSYLEGGGLLGNGHWLPQTELMALGVNSLDFIGKVESLHTDLPRICEKLGIEFHGVKDWSSNATTRVGVELELTYTQISRIEKLYSSDFDVFHYS